MEIINKIKHKLTVNRLLFLISLVFILIRLFNLSQIFLLHDERDIVLSGYSIARTGKDLYGNFLPFNFSGISPNNPLFAIYFYAVWSFFIPFKSVFLARLPFVLISTLLIFIVYNLIFTITKDKTKSVLTTIVLCFSPWIFHITRLALDIPLAIVFLFSGIIFYLKKNTSIAFLLFFLSVFTYQGFRLLLPFLLIYLELFLYISKRNSKQFLTNLIRNLLFFLIIVITFIMLEPKITKNRLSEIVFFNNEKNAQTVDFKRITTIAPLSVSRIFDNKLTVAIDEVFQNLTKGLDISYLYKIGDYSPINGNAVTGQFFFISLVFYVLGIFALGRELNSENLFLAGLIPLGMIPAVLSTNGLSFATRGILSSIGFSYLISLGIIFGLKLLNKNKFKKIILTSFAFLFIINLSYFIYGYYFRRPVTVGELFNEAERQFSNFSINNKTKLIIYNQSPQDLYLSYIFIKQNTDMSSTQRNMAKRTFVDEKYSFKLCDRKINFKKVHDIVVGEQCLDKKTYDFLNDLNNKQVKLRIPYKDFSMKTAYFVIE